MKNVANENLSRRSFLRLAGVCAASVPGYASFARRPAGSASSQGLPNIIFLMSDDQCWDAMGCMGNPVIKTPNMDRLAGEGVLFENAFLTTSICMASRAGIMLGQFESRHKCNFERPSNRTISYAEFDKSYPRILQKAGYRTGFIGKFGFAVSKDKIQNCPLNPDGTRDGRKQLWKEQRQKVLERSIRSKSVRTERYKYIRYFEQRPVIEELFDIRNDPIETFNLAENPEYSKILSSLRKLWDDWIREAQ